MGDFLQGLLKVGSAVGRGALAYDQTRVANDVRRREQSIEDEERAARQRRDVLERALLELNIENAKQGPQPTYGVGSDGRPTMSGARSPDDVTSFLKTNPPPAPKPAEPDEINWQLIQTPTGYARLHPRTGEVKPVQMGGQQVTPPPDEPSSGGPGGETARMAQAMLPLATDAYNRIQAMDTPSIRERLASGNGWLGMGNYFNTPEGRQFSQAANQFLSGALSIVSGRTVSEQEVERNEQIYVPQPGDDATTVANKFQAMRILAESMARLAGQPQAMTPTANTRGPLAGGYAVAPHPENPYR